MLGIHVFLGCGPRRHLALRRPKSGNEVVGTAIVPAPRSPTKPVRPTSASASASARLVLAAPPRAAARPRTGASAPAEPGRHDDVLVVVLPARVRDLGWLLAAAGEDGRRVARALARPEARGVVVGGAREEVAQGVEGEGPDVRVVCLGERRAREGGGLCEGRLGGRQVPVEDRAFGAAGDEDWVDRVPGYGWKEEDGGSVMVVDGM